MVAVSLVALFALFFVGLPLPTWLCAVIVVAWLLIDLRVRQLRRRRERAALRRWLARQAVVAAHEVQR